MPLITDDYGMFARLGKPPQSITVDAYQGQTLPEPGPTEEEE